MSGAARITLAVLAIGSAMTSTHAQNVPVHANAARSWTIRVGMWTLWHDRQVDLIGTGAAAYRTCESCEAHVLGHAVVKADGSRGVTFQTGDVTAHADALWIIGGSVESRAHGESQMLASPLRITGRAGTLVISVEMPVERYVEQVVASEAAPSDGVESLKALAIVARSYALHERHGHTEYDVCDSTHCQLLRRTGGGERRAAAHAATLATAGETLWFHGSPAHAYFSKDCGGHTAAVNEVWPRAARVPYLVSQTDPYCTGEGQQWAAEITRAELNAALAGRGLVAPGWKKLEVSERAESGRVISLRLDGTVIAAEEFRIAVGETLGWNRIPSTWFEVSTSGDRLFFHGRGSGHGVGLCQRGAARMSLQGKTAEEILAHYFPGAYAADEATGARWIAMQGEGFTLETIDAGDRAFVPDVARARAEASERSGLHLNDRIVVRAFRSTGAYRDATLAPGWTAAFTEGNWIAVQPLKTLATRHLLLDTMRHEFLHALVEQHAGAAAPLWLREGLVELCAAPNGEAMQQEARRLRQRGPAMSMEKVETALRNPDSEAQSAVAHREAAAYAARALERYGRATVMRYLQSGVPANFSLDAAQR